MWWGWWFWFGVVGGRVGLVWFVIVGLRGSFLGVFVGAVGVGRGRLVVGGFGWGGRWVGLGGGHEARRASAEDCRGKSTASLCDTLLRAVCRARGKATDRTNIMFT